MTENAFCCSASCFQDSTGYVANGCSTGVCFITDLNEKTVRQYRKQFLDGKGRFTDTKQGKYECHCLLNDEELRLHAAMWAREHAYKKGEANMTAERFCQWVNNDLLPSHILPSNLPRTISVRTANRWLHQLGFTPKSHKKGSYVDGHEREDVVRNREEFLKMIADLKSSHKPPPPCSDEMAPIPSPDAEFQKQLVLIYHDESIFNTNEGQTWLWAMEGTPIIQPKTKGSGIMVSDLLSNIMATSGSQMLSLQLLSELIDVWPKMHELSLNMGLTVKVTGLLKSSWRMLRKQSKLLNTNIQAVCTPCVGYLIRAVVTEHLLKTLSLLNT